ASRGSCRHNLSSGGELVPGAAIEHAPGQLLGDVLRLDAVSNPALGRLVVGRVLDPAIGPPLLEQERDASILALVPQIAGPLGAHRPGLQPAALSAANYPVDPARGRTCTRARTPSGPALGAIVGMPFAVVELDAIVAYADLVSKPFLAADVAVHARVGRVEPMPQVYWAQQGLAGQEPGLGWNVEQQRYALIGVALVLHARAEPHVAGPLVTPWRHPGYVLRPLG